MEPSIRLNLTFSPNVSAKTAGDSDIQQNTVDPLHVGEVELGAVLVFGKQVQEEVEEIRKWTGW